MKRFYWEAEIAVPHGEDDWDWATIFGLVEAETIAEAEAQAKEPGMRGFWIREAAPDDLP